MTVAFRINVGRDGNGRYVLGKGLALGADTAPAPGAFRAAVVSRGAGAAAGDRAVDGRAAGEHAAAVIVNTDRALLSRIGLWRG
ncbi:MAG: hypothetical protein ACRENU_09795 [Gemmatimonadaceae bacterium]